MGKLAKRADTRSGAWSWVRPAARTAATRLGCAVGEDGGGTKCSSEQNRQGNDSVTRAELQKKLSELQKGVRRRLGEVRARDIGRRNVALENCLSKNPGVYWDMLKRTVGIKRRKVTMPEEVLFDGVIVRGDETREVWKEAFRRVFSVDGGENAFNREFLEEIQQEVKEAELSSQFDTLNRDLNQPIVEEEVLTVISSLKQGKAAGVDTLVNEIFKYGGEGIGKATAKLCDEMFRIERIPKDWARGLIFPLFKDGDVRVPDNYRGITLLSVVGKIYTSVLNSRVTKWCEKFGILSEEQAGFRPGRSTVDHIFAVSEVLRLRRARRKETHCCFLDIRKAYDTVNRDALWKRLLDVGIQGKMWRVIKNVYDVVESCVLVGKKRTEWFVVEAGVRQGCILSPILFAIFIDGLARALKRVKVGSTLGGVKFNITLFADDVAILAESREDLQKLLDAAFLYSERWRFKWNCAKSKVMRFGCKVRARYFLGMQELEIVKSFKYLGVDLQHNLAWVSTKWRFAQKAKSRLPMILKARLEGLSVRTGVKLWETMVRPTLEYGVEIWGGGNWPQADVIQNAAGKTLLGLYKTSAVEVARGELGWLSLKSRRDIKQLKYWGKLLLMDDTRLVKQIFRQCKPFTSALKGSFCYSIRTLLASLNLGHLWVSEQIVSWKDWVGLVTTTVKQKDTELWLKAIQNKDKLKLYKLIKSDLCLEEYLDWDISSAQRALYAQFRSGSHQLRVERGRWIKEPEAERVCKVCITGKVENEVHFLLECYVYRRLREKLFRRIKASTGYDIASMKENQQWLVDVLIGHGLANRQARRLVGEAVASFLAVALRLRARILKPVV